MKSLRPAVLVALIAVSTFGASRAQEAAAPPPPSVSVQAPSSRNAVATPEDLDAWKNWVLHGIPDRDAPSAFNDAAAKLPLWPSRLKLAATATGARFSLEVDAFSKTWLALPGGNGRWPAVATLDGQPVPVVEREGRPAIRIEPGRHTVAGEFVWLELPQQIQLPPQIGLLDLSVNGEPKTAPSWDADGTLWLQRQSSAEQVDEDFLSIKVYSLLEDGIPLWFDTQVELIVAGKSREETLGTVLPAGWQLAAVESPLPVAVDENGLLKSQLRAGRWKVGLRAFRTDPPGEIAFAKGATPAVEDQSLAFRARPDFRQAEIAGLPQIDATQTQVPDAWRSLPIYRWETGGAFRIVEHVRGPGERGAAPIAIQRSLWLDDDGKALTFQDRISGPIREIRRFDAADGHLLGSVTANGEPQLITHNPEDGAPGFEVRSPQIDASATGRVVLGKTLPATGWRADADRLGATLHLPPGFRILALAGADHSRGDWLTAWSLLDLFLLLLFTLAVFRLRGGLAGMVAFVAFGLAYHEPGAPRFSWLVLLLPVALVAAMPEGRWRNVANAGKWVAVVILLLSLAPFAAQQIQSAIFPQLERVSSYGGWSRAYDDMAMAPTSVAVEAAKDWVTLPSDASVSRKSAQKEKKLYKDAANLQADPKAIIQTGPGVPTWSWRTVTFGWDGPVTKDQTVRPILIPPALTRPLGIVRVLCLVWLGALLIRQRSRPRKPAAAPEGPSGAPASATAAVLLAGAVWFGAAGSAQAQFPNQELLEELKARLSETTDAFPGAADLKNAVILIEGDRVELSFEFHSVARAAVPLPIPHPAVVPGAVTLSGDGAKADATVLRRDRQFWVLLPSAGIHRVEVSGRLADLAEWEWGFPMKPRHVGWNAEGWSVSGQTPEGGVEDQLLFTRARRDEAAAATYDRPDTKHALLVERQIELGLVWRVVTTVRRLSPGGRAVAVRIPLLPGEKVVSQGRPVEGGMVEVRLAPDRDEATWEGELSSANEIALSTRESDTWAEQWKLAASSVWNVGFSGVPPVFEDAEGQLVPLWRPWPGESATLTVSRPKAVEGAAVTVDSAEHSVDPGRRQTASSLNLSLRTSLGEDFAIRLPAGAEVSSLTHDGRNIPVRKEGDAVVVPLRPGAQSVAVEWRMPVGGGVWTVADAVGLPVEAANVMTVIRPSRDRWLLWAQGPQQGPAVRFWGVLAFALLAAVVLSKVPGSPLRIHEWLLLSVGLTQVPVPLALIVVGWLFFLCWRGGEGYQRLPAWGYNLAHVILILATLTAIGIFIGIAASGLLGDPEMYIAGNRSGESYLAWYQARTADELPRPGYFSISVWWYRLAMLLWALWLAAALVRWLRMGWRNASVGGHFRKSPPKPVTPPKLPGESTRTEG